MAGHFDFWMAGGREVFNGINIREALVFEEGEADIVEALQRRI